MNEPVLYLIIPCYNEEKVIGMTADRVTEKLDGFIASGLVSPQSRICLVDDGSKDRTWELLNELYETNDRIVILRHNRNYGEQYAYLTGIRYAAQHADCMITMDADLQDDINATDAMLAQYLLGNDVVYGVRSSRKQDRRFQKTTSGLFYRFMRFCGTELIPEHSQYRLMSRKAAQALVDHTELNIFLPALIPLFDLKESIVYYERKPRAAGDSHYNVRSLTRLASNAILSYGVYLPYFLLTCAITDGALGILGAVMLFFAEPQSVWRIVTVICTCGAVLFGIAFCLAKRALRRHLIAKNRPRACGRAVDDHF